MHLVLCHPSHTPPPLSPSLPLVGQDKPSRLVPAGGPVARLQRRLLAHFRVRRHRKRPTAGVWGERAQHQQKGGRGEGGVRTIELWRRGGGFGCPTCAPGVELGQNGDSEVLCSSEDYRACYLLYGW